MRVAYVCADRGVPVFGTKGSSLHVQAIVRALRATGAEIELFATRLGGDPPPGLDGLPVARLPLARTPDHARRERTALDANHDLRVALDNRGPFDFVYERHALFSYAAMEFAQQTGVPGLLEVNAPLLDEQQRYRTLVHVDEAHAAVSRAFAAATDLLGVSAGVASYLRSHPATAGDVHEVPNGVDPARFPTGLAPSLPAPRGTLTIGFVGSLKPWHGVETLVEAGARLIDDGRAVRLLIVGDGPQRPELETRLAARGVGGAAVFTGAAPPGEIPALIASMDVATAPYPALDDFYFSPLKIFEYLAAGRAIVASRIGQIPQILEHERTALLHAPGDANALATLLARLDDDEALRSRLGLAARQAAANYTWTAVTRRILAIASDRSVTDVPAGGTC